LFGAVGAFAGTLG